MYLLKSMVYHIQLHLTVAPKRGLTDCTTPKIEYSPPYYISPIEIRLLWTKITYLKSHSKTLAFNLQRRYEIELSYEVLNIDFGQGAAKMSEVKVGGQKKFLPISLVRTHAPIWPLISLQPLDQNQCLVPHFKDLLRICLEIKGQSFWMTFKVYNSSSK